MNTGVGAYASTALLPEKTAQILRENGFGEVTSTVDETVDLIISYMQNGCKIKDEYRRRIDEFFAFNDKNNCQRIADKIVEISK